MGSLLSQAVYQMVMAKVMSLVTIYVVAVSLTIIGGISILDPLLIVLGIPLLLTQLFMLFWGYATQRVGQRGLGNAIRFRDIAFWTLMFLTNLLMYGFLLTT